MTKIHSSSQKTSRRSFVGRCSLPLSLLCISIIGWTTVAPICTQTPQTVHPSIISLSAAQLQTQQPHDNHALTVAQLPSVANGPVLQCGRHMRVADGVTDAVYAVPQHLPPSEWKGVALLLHGCSHSAFKFFVNCHSSECPACIGLSEHMRIASTVVRRGYVAIALSSMDVSRDGCWKESQQPQNIANAKAALRTLSRILQVRHGLAIEGYSLAKPSLPVIAIGASSGGHFAGVLAAQQLVDGGAVVIVSSLGTRTQQQLSALIKDGETVPPIYFAPMPKDDYITSKNKQEYQYLLQAAAYRDNNTQRLSVPTTLRQANGTARDHESASSLLHFDDQSCRQIPVTAGYLRQRVPNLSLECSEQIVQILVDAGQLVPVPTGTTTATRSNGQGYKFVELPERRTWVSILQQQCTGQCLEDQNLNRDMSSIAESFNRANAYHEFCSEGVEAGLDFLDRVAHPSA